MKPPYCLQHQTPLTQCSNATSPKSTDLLLSIALQETNVSHLDCKVLISWPLNDIVKIIFGMLMRQSFAGFVDIWEQPESHCNHWHEWEEFSFSFHIQHCSNANRGKILHNWILYLSLQNHNEKYHHIFYTTVVHQHVSGKIQIWMRCVCFNPLWVTFRYVSKATPLSPTTTTIGCTFQWNLPLNFATFNSWQTLTLNVEFDTICSHPPPPPMCYQVFLLSLHSFNERGVKNACQQFILYCLLTNLFPVTECGIAQCQRIISGVFYYAPEGSERFIFPEW
jgi:hypothetical protein